MVGKWQRGGVGGGEVISLIYIPCDIYVAFTSHPHPETVPHYKLLFKHHFFKFVSLKTDGSLIISVIIINTIIIDVVNNFIIITMRPGGIVGT